MTSPSATQARVLFAGAAIAYVLAVCNFLPVRVWPRMLITVALLIAGIWALAKLFSKKPPTGYGILAVQLTAAAILLLPTFPAMGGDGGAALPVSLAAVSMAGAVWASLRFEGRLEQHANRVPLRTAVWAGLFGALAVSAVATIPIALAFVAGAEEAMKLTLVYPAYLVGGLGAAVTYWLLQPVAHLPWGLYLIGVAAGFFVYGAVGPVVALLDREPIDFVEIAAIGLACGFFVGPPVAFNLRARVV